MENFLYCKLVISSNRYNRRLSRIVTNFTSENNIDFESVIRKNSQSLDNFITEGVIYKNWYNEDSNSLSVLFLGFIEYPYFNKISRIREDSIKNSIKELSRRFYLYKFTIYYLHSEELYHGCITYINSREIETYKGDINEMKDILKINNIDDQFLIKHYPNTLDIDLIDEYNNGQGNN